MKWIYNFLNTYSEKQRDCFHLHSYYYKDKSYYWHKSKCYSPRVYIPWNNLSKCQLQFSKLLSFYRFLNICNKYLFWECFTFVTFDLLLYAPQNSSFKYHANRKSDHSSSSHLHGPISNISSGLHKVMCYKSVSAASIISCNLLLLKCVSYGTSGLETSTLTLEKKILSVLEILKNIKALHGWHNKDQTS